MTNTCLGFLTLDLAHHEEKKPKPSVAIPTTGISGFFLPWPNIPSCNMSIVSTNLTSWGLRVVPSVVSLFTAFLTENPPPKFPIYSS